MNPDNRLPWTQAARVYWYHLLPLPLFVPFVCYTVRFTHASVWGVLLIFAVFFLTSIYAQWPYLRGRVRMSYANFGGFLYVVVGPGLYLICEILRERM